MGRRAFLGRVRLRQELVPAVVPGRCVAHHGCQLCRHSCPHDAIVLDSPVARIEKDHCLACGMCVPACPRDAITFPGFGETELVEQMNVLLSGKEHGEGNEEGERQWGSGGAGGSPTLLFTCRVGAALLDRLDDRAIRSAVSVRELPVPCLGMVTPDLMLQALFQGAGAVGLLGCLERCRSGFTPDRLQARVGFVRELLSGLGQAPDRVEALDATGGHGLVQRLAGLVDRAGVLGRCRMVAGRTGRIGRYESLLALDLSPAGEEPQRLLGEAVPLGLVEVDRERCSVCGLCAARCPTGALSFAGKSGSLSLRFRHSSCAACQICSSVCPEKALVMRRALDLDGLRKGGWVLVESGVTRCRGCGEPLAPAALSHRLRDRLQKSGTSSNLAYLADWCSNCRVVRRDQEQATRN